MADTFLLTFADQLLFGVGVGCVAVLIATLCLGRRAAVVILCIGIAVLLVYFAEAALPLDSESLREFLIPVFFNMLIFGSAWLVVGVMTMKLALWIRRKMVRQDDGR